MVYQSLNNLTNIGVTPVAKFLTNPATVTSKQNIENSQFIYNYKQEAQSVDQFNYGHADVVKQKLKCKYTRLKQASKDLKHENMILARANNELMTKIRQGSAGNLKRIDEERLMQLIESYKQNCDNLSEHLNLCEKKCLEQEQILL